MCYALGVWHTSFALSGNSQTTAIFQAKFGWSEDETIHYNTIISSMAIVGLTLGSFIGGPLIKNGRRKGAIIANVVAIVSSGIAMIGTVPFLTTGRFLLGVAAGIYNVIFGKMIVETMPEKSAQKFAMFHNASICFGIVAAFCMGAFLPDQNDKEACEEDEFWRVIFLTPALIGFVGILLITIVFRQEPISFCIMMGDDE